MGGKKPLRRPLWPPTRATASNYYPLGLDGAGGAAKPLLRAPKKPAPLHGRLPAFSGAVDAFERARKCFLEWRYFFSIILSEFLKNRVALHPIRQIHWKLSEKMGTLMVREFGLPAENQLLLVFLPERSLSPEQLDAMLDTMVSVSSELLRQKLPHTLLCTGELHDIADMPALAQTVHTLLHSAPEIERTTAFLQEHPALSYAHIALIAASAVPAAEDLAQTGCVSILFPDTGALPEIAEPVRVRVHAFRADALRAGTLHFEL